MYGPATASPIDLADQSATPSRSWYEVTDFGAKNIGLGNDDTNAIQTAINTACTNGGGTIYFPPATTAGNFYNVTSPITIGCSAITIRGTTYAMTASAPTPPSLVKCPTCTGPVFSAAGSIKYGIEFKMLGISSGGAANASSQGISLTNAWSPYLEQVFFDNAGSSCLFTTGGVGIILIANVAQNCVLARPTSDTGGFDINNTDIQAFGNFVTDSVCTPCGGAGQLGNGHSYSWIIRSGSGNGQIVANAGDQSHHGWLIAGAHNLFTANRAFQNQGNGFVVTGGANTFVNNNSISNSANSNGQSSGWSITGSQDTFDSNMCDAVTGDTQLQKNCFDDSNSSGSTINWANRYFDNRLTIGPAISSITGVLYNFTGTTPYVVADGHRTSANNGDASITVQCGVDAENQFFDTTLTQARTVTLSRTGAWNGCHFHVIRGASATGAFNLVVGGKALSTASQFVDFEFIDGDWQESAFGGL